MLVKKESQSHVYTHFHKQLLSLDNKLRDTFSKVKEEFDEHLLSINDNTEEVKNFQEYLCELDEKMDKLNARIDHIHIALKQMASEKKEIALTIGEQKMFLMLYTFENGFLSLEDIAVRAQLSADDVRAIISSLLDKGVSLVREVAEGKVFFKLNPSFRERQITGQIVKVNPAVIQQSQNKMLGAYF